MKRQSIARRACVFAGAILAACVLAPAAFAGTVTLTGTSGSSCTYTSVTTAADGNISVACAASSGTPSGGGGSPGTVQFSASTYTGAAGANIGISVVRTGGTSGTMSVGLLVTGAACPTQTWPMTFSDGGTGDLATWNVGVQTTGAGTCTAQLSSIGTSAVLGTPSTATINVTAPTSGGPVMNTVQFAQSAYSLPVGPGSVQVALLRSDNTAVGNYYNVSGPGCSPTVNGQVNWPLSDSSNKNAAVNVIGPVGTTCTVTFGSGNARIGSPSTATITVLGGTTTATGALPNTVELEFPSYAGHNGGPIPVGILLWRGLGNTDAVGLYYNITGAPNCTNETNSQVNWAAGESGRKEIQVAAFGTAGAACQITLGGTNATPGTLRTAPITLMADNSTGPTATAGCPTGFVEPSNLLAGTIGVAGPIFPFVAPTDRVITIPLPSVDAAKQFGTWMLAAGVDVGTPATMTTQASISRCRGYLDPDATNFCNLTSTSTSAISNTWYPRAGGSVVDAASAHAAGACWAPDSQGPWYLNVKMSYSTCMLSSGSCGMELTWTQSP
jgi:hypothetical protein